MQLLAMIMSFIFGRMNKQTTSIRESALEIFEEAIGKSRKVVVLTLAGLGAVTFFCGGIFIAILDATTQYDRNGFIAFSSTLGAGLTLVLLAAIGFAVVFARAWPGATKHVEVREEIHHHQSSGLEQALSILVMDFVKERELKRQQSAPVAPTATTPPGSTRTTAESSDRPGANPLH